MALLRMLKVMHGRWLLLKAREKVTARCVVNAFGLRLGCCIFAQVCLSVSL